MKIVCIDDLGFFSLWKMLMLIEKVTIRTINCYGRLNVLFLREKCAHSTLPITIFICIYLFFFYQKNMLFQFYSCLSLY